jgi:hypothetical protein
MRIRSIKPEFWESESLGRVSREARLLFIGLFSCCDDVGRARASSRLLASRLFPYDDDAFKKLPGWIAELEKQGCIRIYVVDGESYLDLPKWANHQKIDKPSISKLPSFDNVREGSREFENNSLGTGNGNREEEQGEDSATVVVADVLVKPLWEVKFGLILPEKLQTSECLATVETWLAYKAERKQGYKRIGLSEALKAWAKEFTAETFPAAVSHSIANNYQGIFAPRGSLPSGGNNNPGAASADISAYQ